MNKIHKYLTFLSLSALLTLGCEKELNYDWADSEPKLTMFGLITPTDTQLVRFANDSIWTYVPTTYIELSQSTSIFNTQRPLPLKHEKLVRFKNGFFQDSISEIRTTGVFEINGGFEIGENYTLKASCSGFKNIEATVRIPDTVSIESAIYDTSKNEFTFSFIDPPGANFYSFEIMYTEGGVISFQTIDPEVSVFQYDLFDSILIPLTRDFITSGIMGYMTDRGFNGKRKVVKLLIPVGSAPPFYNLQVNLHSINYDYYEFQRTFAAYYSTKDNPFAENVQIRSNIKNGLGLLGAKSSTRKVAIKK